MDGRLAEFLATTDLERLPELAAALGDLDDDEARTVRDVLAAGRDRQAVANLLMYPEVVPEELRVQAVVDALAFTGGRHPALAAAVGAGRLPLHGLTPEQQRTLSARLVVLLSHPDDDVAGRASAALIPLLVPEHVDAAVPHLEQGSGAVRHNVLAALLRCLDPRRVSALVDEAAADGRISEETAAEVNRAIEHGTLDKKTLILRRVMAPVLAPLPDP